jgi:hypothetical protein
MSPEQASGRTDEVDEHTDIFAPGATVFRILASRCVHQGHNPLAIMLMMATQPAPGLGSVAPHVSPSVAAIVDRALEFRRDDRYSSAGAMLIDVDRVLATLEDSSSHCAVPASLEIGVAPTVLGTQDASSRVPDSSASHARDIDRISQRGDDREFLTPPWRFTSCLLQPRSSLQQTRQRANRVRHRPIPVNRNSVQKLSP